MSEKLKIKISPEFDGINLVKWFRKSDIDVPFSLFQKLLRKKAIKVNGSSIKKDIILSAGDEVEIPAKAQKTKPKNSSSKNYIPSDDEIKSNFFDKIIYEDEYVLALNKPQGLAVQGGSKVGLSIDGIIFHLAEKGEIENRYHIVHRLDKDTSGLLLLAKNKEISSQIGSAFKDREIDKRYLTLVVGKIKQKSGRIAKKLGNRRSAGGVEKVVVDEINGKLSITNYKVVKYIDNILTLLEVEPKTGRKHQIRVHLADLGFPILGDGKYGGKQAFIDSYPNNMQLHSWKISSQRHLFPALEAEPEVFLSKGLPSS